MASPTPPNKIQLLTQLITVYRKQLLMSYASGLAAPRKYGPDIIDLAGGLASLVPKGCSLHVLCEKLQDVTWKEYAVNAKDVNFRCEKAFRESLVGKEEILRKLGRVEARWERELLDGDGEEEGVIEGVSDSGSSDDGCSDDGAGFGDGSGGEEEEDDDDDDDEIRQVVYPDDVVNSSPDFAPAPNLALMLNTKMEQAQTQSAKGQGFCMQPRRWWLLL